MAKDIFIDVRIDVIKTYSGPHVLLMYLDLKTLCWHVVFE